MDTPFDAPVTPVDTQSTGTPEDRARLRAQECSQAIQAMLTKYRCNIVPYITMEQIGPAQLPPTKSLCAANYVILPEL